jgi:uncharacterized damage-inducible protein DinB
MTNKDFFIQTWRSEMQRTLNAINGLQTDMAKLSYHCDEKARSAAALLGHMLPHAEIMCVAEQCFIAQEKSVPKIFDSKEDAAAYFTQYATLLADKLSNVDDATWESQIIDFRLDGQSLFAYPMSNTFWLLLFDIIHHRGQLSTYYRHMGVRNPPIYGPTAEDVEAMMAAVHN